MYTENILCLIFVIFDEYENFFNNENFPNYGIIHVYIPTDCSATDLPFLVWGGIRATTSEVRPQNCPAQYAKRSHSATSGVLFTYSGRGRYSQAWSTEYFRYRLRMLLLQATEAFH